jgi:hypothetical protein
MLRYRASKFDRGSCASKSRCCPTAPRRKIPRSIHEGARQTARDIAKTDAYVVSRRRRKRVEMPFVRPNGARDEFHLAAAAQNFRELAKLRLVAA